MKCNVNFLQITRSCSRVVGISRTRVQRCVLLLGTVLSITACSGGSNDDASRAQVNAKSVAEQITADPASTSPVQPVSTADNNGTSNPLEDSENDLNTLDVRALFDTEGLASSDAALKQLLLSRYTIENGQVVPTSAWVCADTVDQFRVYYFFDAGVLDPARQVAVERTLNTNDTLTDITFFWSVSSSDSVAMTSVTTGRDGDLLSTGRQYDVNGFRFLIVDGITSFSASSVLRGELVCASYDLLD